MQVLKEKYRLAHRSVHARVLINLYCKTGEEIVDWINVAEAPSCRLVTGIKLPVDTSKSLNNRI
jgi:hypothetical protein